MNPLEQRLHYKFRNPLLLAEALTHPSLGHETQRHHFDNQRLEFLGDAVLQLIFTEYLFDHFPGSTRRGISRNCAPSSSRAKGLRVHAQNISLGKYLMMGRGEEASGGRERASALADAYEALIGAMYLDSDYVTVRRIVLTEAREHLESLEIDFPDTNPKGRLQELLQSISPQSPKYPIIAQSGPEHEKRFVAKIVWLGRELGEGSGPQQERGGGGRGARRARSGSSGMTFSPHELAAAQVANGAGITAECRPITRPPERLSESPAGCPFLFAG